MKKAILVVEDDHAIRDILVKVFTDEGYKVDAAANGKEALIFLTRSDREPCAVLLDMMMPTMNGWDLLNILQESDMIVTIPIIMFTGARIDKKPKGIVEVIKKPVDMDTLLNTVNNYCNGHPEGLSCHH